MPVCSLERIDAQYWDIFQSKDENLILIPQFVLKRFFKKVNFTFGLRWQIGVSCLTEGCKLQIQCPKLCSSLEK